MASMPQIKRGDLVLDARGHITQILNKRGQCGVDPVKIYRLTVSGKSYVVIWETDDGK